MLSCFKLCPVIHLQRFAKELKMKIKTHLLLLFRDKIQSIKETILPTLITINRKGTSNAQNAEITTRKNNIDRKQKVTEHS